MYAADEAEIAIAELAILKATLIHSRCSLAFQMYCHTTALHPTTIASKNVNSETANRMKRKLTDSVPLMEGR